MSSRLGLTATNVVIQSFVNPNVFPIFHKKFQLDIILKQFCEKNHFI